MDETLKPKLLDLFGKLAVDVGAELDPIYGAAVARMAWRELVALDNYINAKKVAEAKELIRSKMTVEELADEKTKLTVLTFEMAEANAEAWSLSRSLFLAGLKVLIASAAGMVVL